MAKFEPLLPPPRRASDTVTTDELVAMMDRESARHKAPRKWALFTGKENGYLHLRPIPAPKFLYRGQTHRRLPCVPTLFRHHKHPAKFLDDLDAVDAAQVIANIARAWLFISELRHHPVVRWARKQRIAIEHYEMAQHHGVTTQLLDLSESVAVALYFATHEFTVDGRPLAKTDGTGVLYVVDLEAIAAEHSWRFRSVGIQPFARPYRQRAWGCELLMGECFEGCPRLAALEFEHSASFAGKVREYATRGGDLFPRDVLRCWEQVPPR